MSRTSNATSSAGSDALLELSQNSDLDWLWSGLLVASQSCREFDSYHKVILDLHP